MENVSTSSVSPRLLRQAMFRQLHRRSAATGKVTLSAVRGALDEYVRMCDAVFTGLGVRFTDEELTHLKAVMEDQLAAAHAMSPRSNIVISFDAPSGTTLNYRIEVEKRNVASGYHRWLEVREPPLLGTGPDARVLALAGEAADPSTYRVLEVGALTGRNALTLARHGHPVDAVELNPEPADGIRFAAQQESLDVRVIQNDVFAHMDGLREDYQLIVLSGVASDFGTVQQLRGMFKLAARCLASDGRMVFNAFLAREGYTPDSAARDFGQQCQTMIFTRDEMASAAAELPLELIADDSVYDYEKTHLPDGAWPPTNWYANWVSGLDVFDVDRKTCPIEARWLVYRKPG
jgi:precorrin-6B methylase 2